MKFDKLFKDIVKEARFTSVGQLESPDTEYEPYPKLSSAENLKDLDDEKDIFEILGDFRLNKPELFDKFVQRLDDKLFVKMIKDMRGVSL